MDYHARPTRLDDVRIFRCRGPVFAFVPVPYPEGQGGSLCLRTCDQGSVLVDAEGRAIGWAKYSMQTSPNGKAVDVWADAIFDYASEARLLAENGELGLVFDVELSPGSIYVKSSPRVQWKPSNYGLGLKPVEADWRQLFTDSDEPLGRPQAL